jgi:hypothetical protein
MDVHTASIVELKKLAKERKIKQYYIMKRVDLIRLLTMKELPEQYVIEKLTIHQLRDQAKLQNIPRIYKLNRDALVTLLYPELTRSSNENNKNDDGAEKHDDPQQCDA